MPCRHDPTDQEIAAGRLAAQEREAERVAYLDKLTRMLCESLNVIERVIGLDEMSDEVHLWWAAHQEADRKRAEKEEWELYQKLHKKFGSIG